MKKKFKEAHKMTRKMVEEYGVDYQIQFGLNLAYLLENKEEVEMKGTEKQVKYANDIKKAMLDTVNYLEETLNAEKENLKEKLVLKASEKIEETKNVISNFEDAPATIENFKNFLELDFTQRLLFIAKEYGISAKVATKAQSKHNSGSY